MASDGWYGPALENFAKNDGGAFTGPVTVGVLHTTESTRFVPNKTNYFGHSSYPHFTIWNDKGTVKVWQHISIRRAGRALMNRSGGVQTNREGCIQIEVVGSASKPFTNDPVLVKALSALMRWIESQTDIPPSTGVQFLAYPASYGSSKVRLSNSAWTKYAGWLGHQHVPENTHGDPGAINFGALLPSSNSPATDLQEAPMFLVENPSIPGQQWKTNGFQKAYLDGPGYNAWVDAGIPRVTLPLGEFERLQTI